MGIAGLLEISTLGGLSIRVADEPVTGLRSRKVEALLIYLACTGRVHPREVLAEFFWEGRTQTRAMTNLRGALTSLRKQLADYVTITRDTVALNPEAEAWLDVADLEEKLNAGQIEDAVSLYQGEFLQGFSVRGCPSFDDWASVERERLHHIVLDALNQLVSRYLQAGNYKAGITYASRILQLDPLMEEAHRQLMRLLAFSGQRGAALAQYEACRRLLEKELSVEPAEKTTALYQRIQTGELESPAPAPSPQPPVPAVQSVRGYQLQERVGGGGFGHVYRAYQPSVGRQVAVKVILPQHANHPDFKRRFETEARLIAQLEHPHIVPLYDYWRDVDSGDAYLVMRWLGGGDLYDALRTGPWSPEAAARLLDQIAGALDVAHRQGVVHRDIKPENILLDRDGNAYLSDFGIAKDLLRADSTTPPDAIAGSLLYLAPERAQGQPATPRSDLYSLGVVMYEALTGAHPFPNATPAKLLNQLLTEPLPPLRARRSDLPRSLEDVIQRATAKDPAERYPDVLAFAAAFREAISGAPDRVAVDSEIALQLPAFLAVETEEEAIEGPLSVARPVFVGRERELERLNGFLETALNGHGQMVFITGGAGRGKTALMGEFARIAMKEDPDLLVAQGSCNAYSGVGDPYLPFREVMGMLTGDVEARWAADAITHDHASRLWEALPLAVDTLVERGLSLIDIFVPGSGLLSRAGVAASGATEWLDRLRERTAWAQAKAGTMEQSHLFEHYTNVLRALAAEHPLVVLLDDLQWGDTASIGLLFHLGRHLEKSRILIACAYRPEEMALGRPSTGSAQRERHPLAKVLTEFKRRFGDVWVNLDQAEATEGRRFVDAYLDTQPNQLGAAFRSALYRHTEAHPMFTVELLRAMRERGDLVRDAQGRWVAGPDLDWETLPARVEGVIEERVGRLAEELRELLSIASVEGKEFTAQVVARVQEIDERRLLRMLSQDLEQRHRLVREQGELTFDDQRLSRYRFVHALFQGYLYNNLGQGERRFLHRDIAAILEEFYTGRTEEIAVQLGYHYQTAGMPEKAVDYLLLAGDQARALYAHTEAERFYTQAVQILRQQGQDELAARTLMKLALVYTAAFDADKAREAYDAAFALWEPLRESSHLPHVRALTAVLRLALEQPVTLDPGMIGDDVSRFLANQLFEGLVRVGEAYNVLPAVAKRWDVTHNGTKYLFHLREGVHWSDGTALTAADFEYAWKRNLDPSSGSRVAQLLYAIRNARAYGEGEIGDPDEVGVTALDDLTLEVRLEAPTAYLPHLLAHTVAYPLPRWTVERHGQAWTEPGNLVGNGAYQLVEGEKGERLILTRNPFYHGRFPGNAERVACSVFTDFEPALETYAADLVDALSMFNADPHTVARARAAFGDELVFMPLPVTLYLLFRADRPPFDDVRVRRAFVRAIDREALTAEAFHDQRLPATGGFVPPGMTGHSPGIGLIYDPEQARHLLARSGYPGGQGFPQITWLHLTGSRGERVISFLQSSWQQNLGLDLQPQYLEWSPFMERLMGDLADLTLVGWSADYPDPDYMLRVPFHSKQGLTSPRWHNVRFDNLVEDAERVTDHARRMELYQEADRILVAEEAVIMPLTYGRGRVLAKPWISYSGNLSIPLHLNNVVVERREY